MTKLHVKFGCAAALSVALASALGYAASQADAAAPPAAAAAAPPVYRPVTSDLMNEIIQPRHIKLWLAGKAQNWELAEYERHNLQGAFGRMATAIPDYKGTKMDDLLQAFVQQPFADLQAAIKAKDEAQFVKAYGELTASCNNCHQTTEHSMAVVKVPDANAFPDQQFEPSKP